MFIQRHTHNEDKGTNSIPLAFIKSLNIQVYPCGRRRSDLITISSDNTYRIPFDPEARLNTEFNNRRQTSTNGFAQNYVQSWDLNKNTFSFVIGGYTFTINLVEQLGNNENAIIHDLQDFGDAFVEFLKVPECTKIYANIKLEEIPLYARNDDLTKYNTWILRNQSAATQVENNHAAYALDLLKTGANDSKSALEYYFSGLSFSVMPITRKETDRLNRYLPYSDYFIAKTSDTRAQHEFSLCILSKTESGNWEIYEPAKLPSIKHGEIEDSLEVGHINAESLSYNSHPVAAFDLYNINENIYQLHLYSTTALNFGTIEAITGKFVIKTSGTNENEVVVENEDQLTLNFSKADLNVGRYKDAWWAGIKIFAPNGITKPTLEKAVYRQAEGAGWSTDRKFWDKKDSTDDAERHFITIWMPIIPEDIERESTSGDGYLTLTYQFDWFKKGYGASAQTVIFKVNVNKVTLIPET